MVFQNRIVINNDEKIHISLENELKTRFFTYFMQIIGLETQPTQYCLLTSLYMAAWRIALSEIPNLWAMTVKMPYLFYFSS